MKIWNNESESATEIMARSYIRIRKEKNVGLRMEHVFLGRSQVENEPGV